MLRRSMLALSLLAAVSATPAAAEAGLTRIEPRPYYGSVVTVEQGVRVWRPLPPTRHMIINPTGAPVSVNLTDVRETINHHGVPVNGGGYVPVPQTSGLGYGGAYYGAPRYPVGRAGLHRPHRAAGLPARGRVHGRARH